MQREAMSEALEELLFDSDVVGARLELLLPVDGVYWRVLEGVGHRSIDALWPTPELDALQQDASSRSEKPEPEEFQPGTADSIKNALFNQGIED